MFFTARSLKTSQIMKKSLSTLLLSLLGWGCVGTTRSQERVLEAPEYKQMLEKENVLLLDVRTPEEFALGKISKASNLNFYEAGFAKKLEELDKDQTYLIYCAAGGRSMAFYSRN